MSWNSRGLGNPRGVRTLRDLVRREDPDVVFIMETRSSHSRMELLKEVNLVLQSYSQFHFDAFVSDPISGVSWHLSAIYGHPEVNLRRDTWDLLHLLKDRFDGPWLCCGDFNKILERSEKFGGRERPASQMRGFRDALDYCQLRSMDTVGSLYTWCNMREGYALIHERLDRFASNVEWLELFPTSRVCNIITPVSDHSCLVLSTDVSTQNISRKSRSFKFESMWVGARGCEEAIANAWSIESDASLIDKIKHCRYNLTEWSKECFGNVRQKLSMKRRELEQLQILQVVQPCNSDSVNGDLVHEFTASEIRGALFQMQPLKAPGPDGVMPSDLNLTNIVLIPKTKQPEYLKDFRLISLCNVIYKVIAKVLANRLKLALPGGISKNQSAFVPGRLITDNVLVAFETVDAIRRRKRGRKGYMSIKLDMISYKVTVNGVTTQPIKPTRGLRQGCPLSPYLFVLCAEALSLLLKQAEEQHLPKGVSVCHNAPRVSHLFFVDDSIIFFQASVSENQHLKNLICCYGVASGQQLNMGKTELLFSRNTKPSVISAIKDVWGVQDIQHHAKYLGLPSFVGKSHYQTFKVIKDRVWAKLQGWKEKLLSQAGRELLIKAVVQAIPTYAMSCFKIPRGFCKELEGMIARFWWGQRGQEKRIHWLNWRKMCQSKFMGGLGFRDLEVFNISLLARQAVICVRSIFEAKPVIKAESLWRIGKGDNIKIWGDNWLTDLNSKHVVTRCNTLAEDACVADLMDPSTPSWWNLDLVKQVLWNLQLPNKIKNFIWRACKDSLPTKKLLFQRHVLGSSTCVFCHDACEDVSHILCQCPYFLRMWEMYFGRDLRLIFGYSRFVTTVKAVIRLNDHIILTRFLIIAWGVWKFRNLMFFQQTSTLDVCVVVGNCLDYVENYQLLRQHVKVHNQISTLCWLPPPCGSFKLNVDGVIFKALNCSGVGTVLRDEKGCMVLAMSRRELGIHEVEDIEALAALRGLQLISHLGISHLILEGDSLAVMEAICSRGEILDRCSILIHEVKKMLFTFASFEVLHVGRHGNEAAHILARQAKFVDDTLQWWNDPPDFLRSRLEVDAGRVLP
ncbi:hypothetical protein F2P56_014405 [Juglans regia]|uniref:Reverse transcriptase domain-containing protein n=2 Tax=Juglans regia TaxID=51240 RepID=A0A833XD95_JUGRE|nr:uncharacterized protein LOC108987429 [Juglans regia]KAF5464321.1 hypothetical protein F2P56_014405 [Juglans regia]